MSCLSALVNEPQTISRDLGHVTALQLGHNRNKIKTNKQSRNTAPKCPLE